MIGYKRDILEKLKCSSLEERLRYEYSDYISSAGKHAVGDLRADQSGRLLPK